MHNVCITGPAGAGKSRIAQLFAASRSIISACTREPHRIHIDPPAAANPICSVLILDECASDALRRAHPELRTFVERGGRLVLIAKDFSFIPGDLLTCLFTHGGLIDINMALHRDGTRPSFDERFSCAPQRELASRSQPVQ